MPIISFSLSNRAIKIIDKKAKNFRGNRSLGLEVILEEHDQANTNKEKTH